MNGFAGVMVLLTASASAQLVERTQAVPQTPRQALVEVLQSRDSSAIEKHLPEITKRKLRQSGSEMQLGLGGIMPPGGFASLFAGAQKMEVFEAGTTLARIENERSKEKIEITIENEEFRGDEDDFELAIRMYKNGEETMHWYAPRILLHMRQDDGVWRFTEIGFSARMRIADPEFLDAMSKELMVGRSGAEGASAVASLRTLVTAEMQYASSYPAVGFTCTLANLGSEGMKPGTRKQQPNELHAMLIDDMLASGHKSGYRFIISNCDPPPASRFSITAVPESSIAGQRAYCADQSGVIRYSSDGRADTCLAIGKTLQ